MYSQITLLLHILVMLRLYNFRFRTMRLIGLLKDKDMKWPDQISLKNLTESTFPSQIALYHY